MNNGIRIQCPHCGKRLFDISTETPAAGQVEVRCPRCKTFSVLDLASYSGKGKVPSASEPQTVPVEHK